MVRLLILRVLAPLSSPAYWSGLPDTDTIYEIDKLKEMEENAGTIPISAPYRGIGNLIPNCAKTNFSGWASADNRAIFFFFPSFVNQVIL